MKKFTPRRQLPKLLLLNFTAKFLTEQKYIMNNLTSIKIIKSINSQTNNKYSGNDCLTTVFYKHFSNELGLVLLEFMTPGESFALWVLLLEQELHQTNKKKVIKRYCKLETHILQFFRIDCKKH